MYDRWQEKKPKERNQLTFEEAMEVSESIKEIRESWAELEDKIEKLFVDCKHFGKAAPKFEYYEAMKGELQQANDTWGMFDEFK
jgi:hypothetical protein